KCSATHWRDESSEVCDFSKPSTDADTEFSRLTYICICCEVESSIALNTPLTRSVTKRGNDTAPSTLRVVSAMRSADAPKPGCSWARASGGGPASDCPG